jgi:glycosyltransferase involved in cell wall biosynthesis
MAIALDATYSVGDNLSGVGVYSREILFGLARAYPDSRFLFCYRPHRLLRSLRESLPANCRRRLLREPLAPRSAALFHGLNQRLPRVRFRHAVSTFHDLFVLTADYSTSEFRRRFEAQARDAAARSDLIIAVSEFTARQVEELLGVERARIRVVHHGVDAPASQTPPEQRENIVLHVGVIQKRKNVARLVDAFAAMPAGWKLALAGSCGYGAEEALTAIGRSPRKQDILLLGYTPEDQLAQWRQRARICAFPSLDEGFGLPVLEAMANDVPVLTSGRSAVAEVVGDAALLVDPTDTGAIAAGLCELATNPDLCAKLRPLGRARAACFSWSAAIRKTWSAYGELLGEA